MTTGPAGIDLERLKGGDRRTLAKAITLTESRLPAHRRAAQQLLDTILPDTGGAIRVGITGAPGSGKSTFIERLGLMLVADRRRVAVLAVDPSSPVGGGSILGDKTRMEDLSRAAGAYIRPSPTAGALGGVTERTRESILLCEAAGFDVVLIETVGVGQSEYEVADMVDFFLVLMLPGAGDDLQGIKRGILELAHAIVINKADGDHEGSARTTQQQYLAAMRLLSHGDEWQPPVRCCSSLAGDGVAEVWNLIEGYWRTRRERGSLERRRAEQNRNWMRRSLESAIETRLREAPDVARLYADLESRVMRSEATPYAAADEILDYLTRAALAGSGQQV